MRLAHLRPRPDARFECVRFPFFICSQRSTSMPQTTIDLKAKDVQGRFAWKRQIPYEARGP